MLRGYHKIDNIFGSQLCRGSIGLYVTEEANLEYDQIKIAMW